jgi:hypothetical protein
MTSTSDPLIGLAERISAVALELGIPTALIGAMALAAHNYVRGTADIDLATAVDPFRELRMLQRRLEAEGFYTELNLPDAEDSLGGLLRVRAQTVDDDPIDIVNFHNPLNPSKNPGLETVQCATAVPQSSALRCASLAHLVALKLYAGSRRDQVDVVELLRNNPGADRARIREVCARYGSLDMLEDLFREV